MKITDVNRIQVQMRFSIKLKSEQEYIQITGQ
jgi:hypothetical protein